MPVKSTIKWTPFALSCLDEIFDYITFKEKSHQRALNLVNKILDKANQLTTFPESGQPEPLLTDIGQDSRYLVVGNYKIIYEYHPVHDLIVITDVYHTSQDPGKISRTSSK